MYYTLGDTTLHFYRYQCRFYVAHWDGGNVMSDKFKQFIELITEKPVLILSASKPLRGTTSITWIDAGRNPHTSYVFISHSGTAPGERLSINSPPLPAHGGLSRAIHARIVLNSPLQQVSHEACSRIFD